jgi:hypothetical protein
MGSLSTAPTAPEGSKRALLEACSLGVADCLARFGSRETGLSIMVIAVALPYSPLAGLLGFVPLPALYWLWIAGFLAGYSPLTHLVKSWFYNTYGVD